MAKAGKVELQGIESNLKTRYPIDLYSQAKSQLSNYSPSIHFNLILFTLVNTFPILNPGSKPTFPKN